MRLNQLTVPVINLEEAVAFYLTLGFRQIVYSPHYARFSAPEGDTTFSLHVQDAMPTGAGILFYLECDELDDTVEKLKTKGVKFDSMPTDERWLWREARLTDPSGNRICLYHAGENRLNPPWRIEDKPN